MRTGRPIPPVTITSDERETLERWTRRASTAQALAQRARVILGCAAGKSNTRVAHEVHGHRQRGLLRDLRGAVDGAVIHDDDVEGAAELGQRLVEPLEKLRKVLLLIVRREDDGDVINGAGHGRVRLRVCRSVEQIFRRGRGTG